MPSDDDEVYAPRMEFLRNTTGYRVVLKSEESLREEQLAEDAKIDHN